VQSVARAGVLPEMMRESVLLVVTAPTGEQMTLELPPHVAKFIADQVPNVLREMTTETVPLNRCPTSEHYPGPS